MGKPLSIRLSDREWEELSLQAAAENKTFSALVRERLFGLQQADERLEDHERRISRLEEMAGL